MTKDEFKIPGTLNIAIALSVNAVCISLLVASGAVHSLWGVALLSVGYAVVMTTGYGIIHEAEHNLLHENRFLNNGIGVVTAFFFPAPYHLLRQGHLGHHMRNRSDDEAFDYYFEGDNPIWKFMQLYGTMVGCFWIVAFLSNFLAVFYPRAFDPKSISFDRPSQAFLETLNPKYTRWIQLEAFLIICFHTTLILVFQIPISHWLAVLFGFGFLWSAMQYVHHYGTVRDVRRGAKNLRTLSFLDLMWLNHNWHLNHHMQPTVPWIYLPKLYPEEEFQHRQGLLRSYVQMWRGPQFTNERVRNRYAGRIIK
ncbi:MAG: fatty acid desaturase [Bdellovibrionota bacterium]